MNKLPLAKRVQILNMMVEGSSMRAISRVCDVSINTVTKLLEDCGEACLDMHAQLVRNVPSKRVQCDEIWSFCYAKEGRVAEAKSAPLVAGDVWTWTAIDADSKLIISYLAGQRTTNYAKVFMRDLASRLAQRIQLTTDGFGCYLQAVEKAFGGAVDYAMLVKIYANVKRHGAAKHYAPLECVGVKLQPITGNPDEAHISTSFVERQNLTMRMGMRRFTRLTNGHSKKYKNHVYALAIYFMHYNFVRRHQTLRMSPAMAAGLTDRLWTLEDIVTRMDEAAPALAPRGPYKKRAA